MPTLGDAFIDFFIYSFAITFLIILAGFALWDYLRKKEKFGALTCALSLLVVFFSGIFGFVFGAIASAIYSHWKKKLTLENFTIYFLLFGSIINMAVLFLAIFFFVLLSIAG